MREKIKFTDLLVNAQKYTYNLLPFVGKKTQQVTFESDEPSKSTQIAPKKKAKIVAKVEKDTKIYIPFEYVQWENEICKYEKMIEAECHREREKFRMKNGERESSYDSGCSIDFECNSSTSKTVDYSYDDKKKTYDEDITYDNSRYIDNVSKRYNENEITRSNGNTVYDENINYSENKIMEELNSNIYNNIYDEKGMPLVSAVDRDLPLKFMLEDVLREKWENNVGSCSQRFTLLLNDPNLIFTPCVEKKTRNIKYNISNDKHYNHKKIKKIEAMNSFGIHHSPLALNLHELFYRTSLGKDVLRNWHRNYILDFCDIVSKNAMRFVNIHTRKFNKLSRKETAITSKYMQEKITTRETSVFDDFCDTGPASILSIKEPFDLSLADGSDFCLIEYFEEYPFFVSKEGMSSSICKVVKKGMQVDDLPSSLSIANTKKDDMGVSLLPTKHDSFFPLSSRSHVKKIYDEFLGFLLVSDIKFFNTIYSSSSNSNSNNIYKKNNDINRYIENHNDRNNSYSFNITDNNGNMSINTSKNFENVVFNRKTNIDIEKTYNEILQVKMNQLNKIHNINLSETDPSPLPLVEMTPDIPTFILTNNMFKAVLTPYIPHNLFLISFNDINLSNSVIRPINTIFCASQTLPIMEIYSPHSKSLNIYCKNRLKQSALRMLEKFDGKDFVIKMKDLDEMFPTFSEGLKRKWLKEFAEKRKDNSYVLNLRGYIKEDTLSPEHVCQYEGMLLAERLLRDCVIDTEKAPWNLTRNFLKGQIECEPRGFSLQSLVHNDSKNANELNDNFDNRHESNFDNKYNRNFDNAISENSIDFDSTNGANTITSKNMRLHVLASNVGLSFMKGMADKEAIKNRWDLLIERLQTSVSAEDLSKKYLNKLIEIRKAVDDKEFKRKADLLDLTTLKTAKSDENALRRSKFSFNTDDLECFDSEETEQNILHKPEASFSNLEIQSFIKIIRYVDAIKEEEIITDPLVIKKYLHERTKLKKEDKKLLIKCSKCGEIGHMKTNKSCIYYEGNKLNKKKREKEFRRKRNLLVDTIVNCINQCINIPLSSAFHKPVNVKRFVDYADKIKNPIDLSTMKIKARTHQYKKYAEFLDDMSLMLDNCVIYNGKDHSFSKIAEEMIQIAHNTRKKHFDIIILAENAIKQNIEDKFKHK
ncbi:hypothetical protein EDEG_02786 [Edhazardia aedis USNM 41457]|uniref:Bromo domain-containing protein n=1 Tax=Edhazardia aedis (strain USNM 41457) TaxID=1003232 RepID=J9DJP4_EDHAE|nr:hypothetical protein EDEG_02786 [Edhazardia aedis USNM 41457]|eukprot:EJW02845.1 hypothetical protein EDEG_02786 [Edhazardia aedis USNM 41457]